jgi:hypothetical protein
MSLLLFAEEQLVVNNGMVYTINENKVQDFTIMESTLSTLLMFYAIISDVLKSNFEKLSIVKLTNYIFTLKIY